MLAGGGTKGSFEVGALQYLVGTERIIPDIIAATSAGAVAAAVLAQARTFEEFARRVQEVEDDILAMTRTEQIFGEQAWLQALEGTTLGGEIRSAFTKGTRPPLPALRCTVSLDPDPPPNVPRRLANKARRRRRRWARRLLAGAALRLPRARRRFRTSGSSILNLRPLAHAMRYGGPSGIHPVDPDLVRRPGLELRLAVTALRAGVLRYVTQDGTIVEEDALTPAPGSSAGPVDLLDGVIASASVPMVFPPRALAGDDYVDGGVLQVVPVRAAAQLGATRVIAVMAVPLRIDRDERNYSDDNAVNVGLRALGVIAMADRQRENLAVHPAAGWHPHYHRSRRRRGRLLRGRAGPPAHQQGLRMAAGGRRHGRGGRHRAGRGGRRHPPADRRPAARPGTWRRRCGPGTPSAATPIPAPSRCCASSSARSTSWSTSASSWASRSPTGARSGGPATRPTGAEGRSQTVGPPSQPRRLKSATSSTTATSSEPNPSHRKVHPPVMCVTR